MMERLIDDICIKNLVLSSERIMKWIILFKMTVAYFYNYLRQGDGDDTCFVIL